MVPYLVKGSLKAIKEVEFGVFLGEGSNTYELRQR